MSTCMPSCNNISYMLLNLVAEVGEFSGKLAKAIRKENVSIGGFSPDNKNKLAIPINPLRFDLVAFDEELKKYKYVKKSKSELEKDRIIDSLTLKLWGEHNYLTIYYLGILSQFQAIAEGLGPHGTINRDDILMLINTFKTNEDMPDEIKNLVDMILDEFDYKEN